jgi:Tol biopolymer transport system component/predicted Ser/Thr protein kinase
MPLSIGDKLGPYGITAPLGKGGMGEVYKAHDSRLNRDVAIKVSAEQFSDRFSREARAIAALNHTNVCHLYDVGPNYLVMEYVEGTDLRGPLDFDDALPIIQQLIDGIEAAHEKGITHRDLKPANIKITPEGVVKILDFGLAKLDPVAVSSGSDPENSPTMSMAATAAGAILGTAAYMSPEQAKGKQADRRADIWAFGVILYEVLTGKRLFQGESAVEILGGVLNREPDISAAPVRVYKLLRWCLEKDRRNRLQAIGDARRLLSGDTSGVDEFAAATAPLPSRLGRIGWITAGLMALVATGASWIAWRATRPVELKPLVRLDVDLGSDVSLGTTAGAGADAILSPDGTRLVYVSQNRIFTRLLDQTKATELPGTDGGFGPFFSPDGQWVGFFAQGKLKKVAVAGGAALALCDYLYNPRGGSWGEDGTIFASLNNFGTLSRIPLDGGTPAAVTELRPGESTHRWPQILPGGKAVLFTAHVSSLTGFDGANIEVMSLGDHKRKTLVRGGTFGRYLPGGYLLYVNRGTLFAVPFDLNTLALRGAPTPVLEQVAYSDQNGSAQLGFSGVSSGSGTLIYRSGQGGDGLVTLQWLDGSGKGQPLLAKTGAYTYPRLSPDGQRLALVVSEGSNQDIWVYEWLRDTMTRVTFNAGVVSAPIWSPDGRFILFQVREGISWTRSDGGGKPRSLIQMMRPMKYLYPTSFSPDGKRLAFYEGIFPAGDLWTASVQNEGDGLQAGKPEPFLQTPFDERQPTFSPDGKWLAYSSNESGTAQIHVRTAPGKSAEPSGKWQVSSNGGQIPTWSRNGHELFFRTEDNRIMVTNYTVKGESFVADKPRVWFQGEIAGATTARNFDLAPDGKRIAALMPAISQGEKQMRDHVIFLENFFDELKRKVPAGK